MNHKVTRNIAESCALAINNGCQLNCGRAYTAVLQAVEMGLISEEVITASVEKLMEARIRLGMFDDDCEYDKIPYDVIECEAHTKLNREMARESTVLLKNNGILPLDDKKIKTIAVIGPNADSKTALLGNYFGTPSRYSTLLRGIQDSCDCRVIYARGCHLYKPMNGRANERPINEALIAAKMADAVILCMGLDSTMEGEQGDGYNSEYSGDKPDIELPASQMLLMEKIAELKKPTAFVNVSGSCMNLSFADKHFDAVLQCFYPGAEGGNALADILFGRVSPSGRLPVSFYKTLDDYPDFEDYSMENRTYKFYKGTPLYDFGYGLTYSDVRENWIDESTVELENAGEFDTAYSVLKFEYIPHKNLCGFKKVFLKAGKKLTVKF
jgi:beta-glucosidase